MITKEFVVAGKAIFTLEIPHEWAAEHGTNSHYTYRVAFKQGNDGSNGQPKTNDVYFVSLLSGPDNYSNYSYLGILNKDAGFVSLTRASKVTKDCMSYRLLNRVLANLWVGDEQKILEAGFDVHHEGKCGRCGKKLTVPESVKTGLGPDCAGRRPGKQVDEEVEEEGNQEPF